MLWWEGQGAPGTRGAAGAPDPGVNGLPGEGSSSTECWAQGDREKGQDCPSCCSSPGDGVICAMCVPDANLPLFISCFISVPVPRSSLSFLVKLEQLDLGGNDLEVLVGEGCWGGLGWLAGVSP